VGQDIVLDQYLAYADTVVEVVGADEITVAENQLALTLPALDAEGTGFSG